jgi:hypothetical protein
MPQIDHFNGQKIEEIGDTEDGWFIKFETGAMIYNNDPAYDKPDDVIIGLKLSLVTLSGTTTQLWFGTDENPQSSVMNLNPLHYTISNPDYEGGRQVNPQWPEELSEAGMEPSAPGERVVEGPEEQPEEDAAEAPQKASKSTSKNKRGKRS